MNADDHKRTKPRKFIYPDPIFLHLSLLSWLLPDPLGSLRSGLRVPPYGFISVDVQRVPEGDIVKWLTFMESMLVSGTILSSHGWSRGLAPQERTPSEIIK
jgi:hypothetical protein